MAIRTRLLQIAYDIRDSYWFLPSLIAGAGLALGLGIVLIDAQLGDAWLGQYEWFYGSRPEGARAMLSTIAGSTITVAGVVFSITLAAVTYASGQFGPRLLGNFMRDRGNQVTLGVFIGTYLYCLIVLRTIRSAEETSADTGGAVREAFVPHVAMFGGLALAIASTVVLIYFVHHVTSGIHINNVIARVGQQLIFDIRKCGDDQSKRLDLERPSASPSVVVAATKTGYIQSFDLDALLMIACRHRLVLRLTRRAGDFVLEGRPLMDVLAPSTLTDEAAKACDDAVTIGRQRSDRQDLRFAVDELVEIASRALSPGINDPFTAIACLDWLGAALAELDRAPPAPGSIADTDGVVRIVLMPLGYEDYLASAFGQLRSYVAADPNALAHALTTLDELATNCTNAQHRILVEAERSRLVRLGDDNA